jgi:hypothetical protein
VLTIAKQSLTLISLAAILHQHQLNESKVMTKSEANEIKKTVQYFAAGLGLDYLARALSAIHRAARGQDTKRAIEALATEHSITQHPEFKI